MDTYFANHRIKNKAINAMIHRELVASSGMKTLYWISTILKVLGCVSVVGVIVYALFVSKDYLDLIYALIPILVFFSLAYMIGAIYQGKLAGEYRCRQREQLTVMDDKLVYLYHDIRLPLLTNSWMFNIRYDQIEEAEISPDGYLVTFRGEFDGGLYNGNMLEHEDVWSFTDMLNVFGVDMASILHDHNVNVVQN